jgi:hypothetical protein
MTKSESHKRAQRKAAGGGGTTEAPLPKRRRLNALSQGGERATEVERSGDPQALEEAARRLKDSGAAQKVLQVPDSDMSAATAAMRNLGVSGTIKNMSGTKRRSVRKH